MVELHRVIAKLQQQYKEGVRHISIAQIYDVAICAENDEFTEMMLYYPRDMDEKGRLLTIIDRKNKEILTMIEHGGR